METSTNNSPIPLKLKAQQVTGQLYLVPNCHKSELLKRLLRRNIMPIELPVLADIGFDIQVSGDLKEYKKTRSYLNLDELS